MENMSWTKPLTLTGQHCILAPLSEDYHDQLVETVQDGELWNLWYTTVPRPEAMHAEIKRRLALQAVGEMLPFVVLDSRTHQAVGMTTYMNIEREHCRLEIGSTWYCKSVQRTAINTEAKTLLLTHAFEILQCHAVEFRTHVLNHASRRGIERLGAKLDGILRNHRIMSNGTLRDTCVYSIISNEWPTVKASLAWLAQQPRM